LSGEWRDPLVGRDILIGCAFGVVLICYTLKFGTVGVAGNLAFGSRLGLFVAYLANAFPATMVAMGFLCLLCIFQFMLRSEIAAVVLTVLAGTVLLLPASPSWFNFATALVFAAVSMIVLTRFGLLALAVAFSVTFVFQFAPMTLDPGTWYSTAGFAAMALLVGLALFGFFTSIGGRPILALGSED